MRDASMRKIQFQGPLASHTKERGAPRQGMKQGDPGSGVRVWGPGEVRGPLTFSLLLLQKGWRLGDTVRDGCEGRSGVHGCGDRWEESGRGAWPGP